MIDKIISCLANSLKKLQIQSKIDDSSGSIGRRYARADELGIPFGITVDFQSLKDASVTLRERDTMEQIRIKVIVYRNMRKNDQCNLTLFCLWNYPNRLVNYRPLLRIFVKISNPGLKSG